MILKFFKKQKLPASAQGSIKVHHADDYHALYNKHRYMRLLSLQVNCNFLINLLNYCQFSIFLKASLSHLTILDVRDDALLD